MKKYFFIRLQKANDFRAIILPKNARVKLAINSRWKSVKNLHNSDIIFQNWTIRDCQKIKTKINLKLSKNEYLEIPDIQTLIKKLNAKSIDNPWELATAETQKQLKDSLITEAYKTFLGVTFKDIFGRYTYVSGQLCFSDFIDTNINLQAIQRQKLN